MKNKEEIYRAFCHYYSEVIKGNTCQMNFFICNEKPFVKVSEKDFKWLESIRNTEIRYSICIKETTCEANGFFAPEAIIQKKMNGEVEGYYVGIIPRTYLEIMMDFLETSIHMRH